MKIPNLFKIILGIIATIFLGALGSGIWEKILSPLFSYLAILITETASYISSSYSNAIYTKAARLDGTGGSRLLAFLILLIVFIWLFFHAINSKKDNKFISVFHQSFKKQLEGWSGIIFYGAYSLFVIFLISTESTTNQIRSYSANNIEIVRPYINEKNYLLLRSQYLQMKTKDDFDVFLKKLHKYATENSLKIDEFSLK